MLLRALVVLVASNVVKPNYCTGALSAKMGNISVDFEVFGKVQGVFFRKYTKEQADKLGVRGWCKNTPRGTVQGQLEGSEDNIQSIPRILETGTSITIEYL